MAVFPPSGFPFADNIDTVRAAHVNDTVQALIDHLADTTGVHGITNTDALVTFGTSGGDAAEIARDAVAAALVAGDNVGIEVVYDDADDKISLVVTATGDPGPQGQPGATGPKGDTGPRGTAGLGGIPGATGPQGLTGPIGASGATGPIGATGSPGGATGATGPLFGDPYLFSTSLFVDINPGSGYLRFSSSSPGAVTTIALSDTTSSGAGANFGFRLSSSEVKGILYVKSAADPNNVFRRFTVHGAEDGTPGSGWTVLDVTWYGDEGTLTNNMPVVLVFVPTGDKGDPDGPTGPAGPMGPTGPKGDPGDQGDPGSPGGATGATGPTGASGPVGATGPSGGAGDGEKTYFGVYFGERSNMTNSFFSTIGVNTQYGEYILVGDGTSKGLYKANGTNTPDTIWTGTPPEDFFFAAAYYWAGETVNLYDARAPFVRFYREGGGLFGSLQQWQFMNIGFGQVREQQKHSSVNLYKNLNPTGDEVQLAGMLGTLDTFFGNTGGVPVPPSSGTYTLKSINKVLTWVAD